MMSTRRWWTPSSTGPTPSESAASHRSAARAVRPDAYGEVVDAQRPARAMPAEAAGDHSDETWIEAPAPADACGAAAAVDVEKARCGHGGEDCHSEGGKNDGGRGQRRHFLRAIARIAAAARRVARSAGRPRWAT